MVKSAGEKYIQLMAAFMKRDGARLIDMTQNSADMKIIAADKSEENFSIIGESGYWQKYDKKMVKKVNELICSASEHHSMESENQSH